ncbi:DUF3422 family protein [Pseudoduganella sp. DS3]|uniref:DUF3422 family protein n=1 Tax=Pseudoduganella guangdongensis TaxID=2692179 RepID=A0A6N9HI93_9BURK|nr:DUF3422 domain-containing protein [Pseudoduganella guangdongensis]MYN03284.1 DUF3422 family protein [Pseudoduganella guangdongensis]
MSIVFSSLNHAQRIPLAAEIHSRPFLMLEAPTVLTHFAILGEHGQQELLAGLCGHFGVTAPAAGAKYFSHDFGRFRLKWELHTEFATFTFAESVASMPLPEAAFASMPSRHLPEQWLLELQGRVLVASHVLLARPGGSQAAFAASLQRVFQGAPLAGSQVMNGGELWTDFAIHADGFSRFVICDTVMHEQQAGRLVQRVLEIETYRMMALLALPLAHTAVPELNAVEAELAALAGALVEADGKLDDGSIEQKLLDRITHLAARIEKVSADTSYRFAAAKAYFGLVNARIEELRELRIEGAPTVEEFMERRLEPAMKTCEAVAARQQALAGRIANCNDLLRTRVGIVQEAQNRKILQSMNARAAQQLRLQQAVEGLSVAAISYYLVGLVGYTAKGAKALGWVGNPELLMGVMVPVVALAVWIGLRCMHKRLHQA